MSCARPARPGRLPRATPESQGVSSPALLAFVDALESRLDHVHSVMVVRGGRVIAEGWWAPYRRDRRHALFSISKSFTSSAIGLLVGEGRLSLDDRVVDLLPDDAPPVIDARLAALRVRHLLSMSTGHERDGLDDVSTAGGWARRLLAVPVAHEPGTRFMYETGATYLLSAIAARITGERLLDYLAPRLLGPLGVEGATWRQSPDGIDVGGFGLSAFTEDIAALGELYLRAGMWEGMRVLPDWWVATATAAHVSNGDPREASDWTQGYGFQFWRGRHGSFRADGAFGQLCVVLPEQDVVVAVTAGLSDMQAEMDVLWDCLLPALGEPQPLVPDSAGHARLVERLAGLRMPLPEGSPTSSRMPHASHALWRLEGDGRLASLELSVADDRVDIRLGGPRGEVRLVAGHGRWLEGGVAPRVDPRIAPDGDVGPVMGAYAWRSDDRLEACLLAVDTAIRWVLTLTFTADRRLDLELRQNVSFGDVPVIRARGAAVVEGSGASPGP